MQSFTQKELVCYLSFFKSSKPPLTSLLDPLYRLVLNAKPQPNFILSFPVKIDDSFFTKEYIRDLRSGDRPENLVNNYHNKHLAAKVCSPWSIHAICLPIGPESTWPLWLNGSSMSLWVRVERNISNLNNTRGSQKINITNVTESDSFSDWGLLSDNWSREGS